MKKFLLASAVVCTAAFTGCSAIKQMNFEMQEMQPQMTVAQTSVQQDISVEEIINELNLARTSPRAYANILKTRKQYYKGKVYAAPGQTPVGSHEGLKAVDEAIRYLESVSPMNPLKYSQGLSKAAMDHVNDIGPKGTTSHTGSDGTRVNNRIERYGEWRGACGENIMYGALTSRDIVVALIIDDGVADRGHRRAIFTPEYALVGAAYGYHSDYDIVCVQNFAASYREGVLGTRTAAETDKPGANKVRTASRKK
jgi:uncharacterized protein YkwD